jgi:hypothetical protein
MAVINVRYTNCALLHSAAIDLHNPFYGRRETGYGDKLITRYKVKYGETPRQLASWRRVYAVCWGNASSLYIEMYGERLYLDSGIEYFLTDGVVDERMAIAQ